MTMLVCSVEILPPVFPVIVGFVYVVTSPGLLLKAALEICFVNDCKKFVFPSSPLMFATFVSALLIVLG